MHPYRELAAAHRHANSPSTYGRLARHSTRLLALFAAVTLSNTVLAATGEGVANSAHTRLHELYERTRERQLRDDPRFASADGDTRYNSLWPNLSPASLAGIARANEMTLKEISDIGAAGLSPQELLNRELFRRLIQNELDRYRYGEKERPVDQLNSNASVLTLHETTANIQFVTVKDYEDWIARIRSVGPVVDQTIALMREGVKRKNVNPRHLMVRARQQLQAQLGNDPDKSPYFEPFRDFPATIDPGERGRLIGRARSAIRDEAIPAYRRLDVFLEKEYLPKTRATVGVWDTPQGEAYYRNRIAWFTTTSLSPDEIHEIGLKEIERIRGEMRNVAAQTGFVGSLADFFLKLRNDPRFKISDPDKLLAAYQAQAKRVDPHLTRYFGKLPRIPYGVRPMSMASAPDSTSAFYFPASPDGRRPGYFAVNLYKPEERPTYEIPALTFHEAVPGHHLQMALAYELGELPKFRREFDATAFVEGWALYAESLGEEMGLLTDPYDKFGQLTFDMWRALRLVIDTGIHAKRWNREQAIALFKANTAKSDIEIENEVDRYIAWPGQALAYKLGQLKIRELRALAEQTLGARFDIRNFHDAVLANGPIPLDVLERNIKEWLAAQ